LPRPILDNRGDLVPAVTARCRGREARIARELAASDDLAEPAPYRVARPGRDGHVAVGRRVDARARAAERHIAGPREHFAADGIALAEVVERDQQAVEQRQGDALSLAGAMAVVQGGHDAEGAQHSGVVVRDGLTGSSRGAFREAGDAHVPAYRLRQHFVAALRRIRAALAARGDRRVYKLG